MTTEGERVRLLGWEGCLNVRDLGGYPTVDGRETRWGAVVRADNLARLTETGRTALVEYGVRSIVDLRLPVELDRHPNPFARSGPHGIVYVNVSLLDPGAPSEDFVGLAHSYIRVLERFRPAVATIVSAIARAPEGGVLIHCMGGKDRTGIVSALLLELAGVPRETIGADYALTQECLRPQEEDWLENGPGDRAWREREVAAHMATVEVMPEVLEYLDRRYGGVEGYLRGAGVAAEDISGLRARLVPL